MRTAVALVVLLMLAACAGEHPDSAAAPGAAVSVSDPPGPEPRWSLERLVQSPSSYLMTAHVERTADGLRVVSAWSCGDPGCGDQRAFAVSTDGFRTVRYRQWSQRRYQALLGPAQAPVEGLDARGRLPAGPVVSFAPDADRHRVVVLGGDGATLAPLEAVAHSTDGGATWTTHEVPRGSSTPFMSGHVVLRDGRMLILFNSWSSDRRGRPGPEHHGLWVSTDSDLTRFTPYRPTFDPPPTEPKLTEASPLALQSPFLSLGASTTNGGMIWMQTWDARLWVSADGAAFREIRVR